MVCGADGSIKLWSVETGTPTNLILSDYGLDLTCIDLSSNRQWLAQGTTNQGLQIVQLPSDSDSVIAPFIFKLSFSLKGKLVTVYGFTITEQSHTKANATRTASWTRSSMSLCQPRSVSSCWLRQWIDRSKKKTSYRSSYQELIAFALHFFF